ncbi:MAG: TOBE domain-containing protein, partial [Mesorhizobium sp.]
GWPFAATANVEVVEPMGSDTLVWLKLGGQNFTVRVTSERTPKNGDPVGVGFDPMRASLFDAQTGNRI